MARITNLDMDALRSFVRGFELGSFARAAAAVGRSQSALSAQLRKLEMQVGEPLVRKSGRGVSLTAAGEALLGYAERMLKLNDEAMAEIGAAHPAGSVSLGVPPDFAEAWLAELLGRYARLHPTVQVVVHADRSRELGERIAAGRLDLALAWGPIRADIRAETLATVPVGWIGTPAAIDGLDLSHPLGIAAFDDPCPFRRSGLAALDEAGIAWRLAFISASLPGLWSAVGAGLGLTVRTPFGLPPSLRFVARHAALPRLAPIALSLIEAEQTRSGPVASLAALVAAAVRDECARIDPDGWHQAGSTPIPAGRCAADAADRQPIANGLPVPA